MKNIIKVALSSLLFIAVLYCAAFADEEAWVTLDPLRYDAGNKITVSGILLDITPQPVTVKVVYVGNGSSDIARIDETFSKSDGTFSLDFIMRDNRSDQGLYKVFVNTRGAPPVVTDMYFYTTENRRAAIIELNALSTRESVGDYLGDADNFWMLRLCGMYMDEYIALSGFSTPLSMSSSVYQDNIADAVVKSQLTFENASEIFNRLVAVEYMNALTVDSANAYDTILHFREQINSVAPVAERIGSGSVIDWLNSKGYNTELYSKIFSGKPFYANLNSFVSAYDEAAVVTAFNKALWVNMEEILNAANYYLNLDLAKGNTSVYQAMVKNYNTSAQIKQAFNDAAAQKPIIDSPPVSGGGGGGGGGGRTITMPPAPPLPVIPVLGETSEQSFKFNDIDSVPWATDAIKRLLDDEIVSESPDYRFRPNDNVTREEFIKMLVMSLGIYSPGADCDFDDVAVSDWHYKYIAFAVENGITNGIGDNSFGVGLLILRQDAITLLNRALSIKGINLSSVAYYESFMDEYEISDYALESIKTLYSFGLIQGNGDGIFAPLSNMTRAEAAVILYRTLIQTGGGAK